MEAGERRARAERGRLQAHRPPAIFPRIRGQKIGNPVTAQASDGDPLTYIVEGSDAASFEIDSKTGQIKTKADVTYDYETKDTYAVTVKATDSSRLSDTIAVTILVTDVDEKPTTPDTPTVIVPEGSSQACWRPGRHRTAMAARRLRTTTSNIGRIQVGTWSDWGHDGTGTTTMITGLAPHTDYQVRVRASNGDLHSDWSPPGSGQTNNTVPFADTGATRSFPENTPPGQDIGSPVAAGDPDGDPLVHTLSGPDAASFDIDSETGQIKTRSGVSYDYEVKASYAVTVQATDLLATWTTSPRPAHRMAARRLQTPGLRRRTSTVGGVQAGTGATGGTTAPAPPP